MRKCPFCAQQIQDEAIVCWYCNRDLPETPAHKVTREQAGELRRLRFAAELIWLVLGALFIISGLTGQTEGRAEASVISVIIGVCLVGWSCWRWQVNRLKRP
jgi:hypothetical protein